MCSTHNGVVFTLTLGLIVFAGCQRTIPPPIASPVNNTPLVIDEAMQIRNAEPSTSYYATGAAVAGGTGYLWQTHETIPDGYRRYTDVPVCLANFLALPVGVFVESPWEKVVYRGETVPPSYTAQPPLPK
jgi:hypothetical protein